MQESSDAVDLPFDRGELPSRPRGLVVGLLVAIIAFFIAQDLTIRSFGEPFPGLVLPSFVTPIDSDVVTKRTAELHVEFDDEGRRRVDERAFVARTTARPFDLLNTMFWMKTEKLASGQFVPDDPQTAEFTRARLVELFPHRTPTRFTVTWTREATNLDGTPNPAETRVVRTVDVEL